MMYEKALSGLIADVRGTALTRLRELSFTTFADLTEVEKIMSTVRACEKHAEQAYQEISALLDTM